MKYLVYVSIVGLLALMVWADRAVRQDCRDAFAHAYSAHDSLAIVLHNKDCVGVVWSSW